MLKSNIKPYQNKLIEDVFKNINNCKESIEEYYQAASLFEKMIDKIKVSKLYRIVNELETIFIDKCPVCETPINGNEYRTLLNPYENAREKLKELESIANIEQNKERLQQSIGDDWDLITADMKMLNELAKEFGIELNICFTQITEAKKKGEFKSFIQLLSEMIKEIVNNHRNVIEELLNAVNVANKRIISTNSSLNDLIEEKKALQEIVKKIISIKTREKDYKDSIINGKGISCTSYHAGNEKEIRKLKEKGMMENQWKCILSTNALGMGIDKSDISYIIHTQMPASPIHYYQEIGRAGRDGCPVDIILLYNEVDSNLPLHFIDNSRPKQEKYNKVIGCLMKEPLGLFDLIRETGLTQTPLQVILNDLLDQNIIIKVSEKRKIIYEYLYNAPKVDFDLFETYRQYKLEQLLKMQEYINGSKCRMAFLCEYLGDKEAKDCNKCDNCRKENMHYDFNKEIQDEVKRFHDEFHPVIELVSDTESKKTLADRKIKLTDGVAFSYYGTSQIGHIIHQCKYENGGDFPEAIIKGMCNTYLSYYKDQTFDIIMYIPPTESGDLVRNLASEIGRRLKTKVSHELIKLKETKPQKLLEVSILKKDNLKDAFGVGNLDSVIGKKILLIDDICDSKATLREVGKLLSQLGAIQVSPLVIAKTVGGDQV